MADEKKSDGGPMPIGSFAHLHLHTEFSLLDGGNRLDKLMARCKELGMGAVACTDHGNMFGAVAFYTAAKNQGIKPILGTEAYVAQGSRHDRTHTGESDGGFHLVLLAENDQGWANLCYLASQAYLTGFYYKPRMDREILRSHNKGIIAINGHLGSEIGEHLQKYEESGDESYWRKAVESAEFHASVFTDDGTGPRFFIELQHHIPEQNAINKHLIRLARELKLPLVCDNDAHYLRAEDHDAHDTLVCISTGKGKLDTGRMRYSTELYVKSPEQMAALFKPYGDAGAEAMANTVAIANRCNVKLGLGGSHAPLVRVRIPKAADLPKPTDPTFGGDLTAWYKAYCAAFEVLPMTDGASDDPSLKDTVKTECDTALRMLSEAGFIWRYGPAAASAPDSDEKKARLIRELKILADKTISAYFLIVWDFVNWGRQQGIPALARGSGVGTMVGYVLGLSNACPVQYGLLFERFTDPDRSEYPDIDIDLCQDGRSRVINYVRNKYGHVAQIITFGTLKAKAAIRDVGRVMELPIPEVDRIAKLIPETLNITLDEALDESQDLKALYDKDSTVRRVLDHARALEGQSRHASVHAAGVIVATRPLHEIVPLYRPPGTEDTVTQWDGPTCEKMGLLKMDFLGLRTLSVVERAKGLIREGLSEEEIWKAVGRGEEFTQRQAKLAAASKTSGKKKSDSEADLVAHPLDLDRLSFADQTVFEMFRRGDTTGVFQFESGGMRRLLMEMKPDRLEDLIAANALFRPGPMDLIPDYNKRKHGTEEVPFLHDVVSKYTGETYGVMVYQEQVMQIVHGLGGIPLRSAYSLIKAISKKKEGVINAERPRFIEGALKQGLKKEQAESLFDMILKFAGYGFNKSHSTGYAIVAYQTAYLKTYFPNQYMAAFLTYESGASQIADWVPYLEDCKNNRFVDPITKAVIKVGVQVKPPDVNLSKAAFSVVFDPDEPHAAVNGHVRFGLSAIKGVGDKAIEAIVAERDNAKTGPKPYASIFDFCERVSVTSSVSASGASVAAAVNKSALEALIKSGSMDCLHGRATRSAMLASIEAAVTSGATAQRDKASGQGGLFGFGGDAGPVVAAPVALAKAAPWDERETLANEKEILGFYISSHPLDQHKQRVERFGIGTSRTIKDKLFAQDARIVMPALIQSIRVIMLKNGQSAGRKMAVVQLEDKQGPVEAVAFPDTYEKYQADIVVDNVVFAVGKVDLKRGEPQVVLDRIVPIDQAEMQLSRKIRLVVDEQRLNGHAEATLERVASMLSENLAPAAPAPKANEKYRRRGEPEAPTGLGVELVVITPQANVFLDAARYRISSSPALITDLQRVLGDSNVQLVGG